MSLYIDRPLKLDWDKLELLDTLSVHDEEWKIETRHTDGGTCYDLEATGAYSCGELVEVNDIEVINASGEDEI